MLCRSTSSSDDPFLSPPSLQPEHNIIQLDYDKNSHQKHSLDISQAIGFIQTIALKKRITRSTACNHEEIIDPHH